jgi:hypothetical protein
VVTNYHKLDQDAGELLTCIRGVPGFSVSIDTNNIIITGVSVCFSESEVRTRILNLNTVASFHIPYGPFNLVYSG